MTSIVTTKKPRRAIAVAMPAAHLDRHLFTTEAQRVMVPTPGGKPTWLRVDNVLRVEPAP